MASTIAEQAAAKAKQLKAAKSSSNGNKKEAVTKKATKKAGAAKKEKEVVDYSASVSLLHDLQKKVSKFDSENKAHESAMVSAVKNWKHSDSTLQLFMYFKLNATQAAIREAFRKANNVEQYRSMSIWGDDGDLRTKLNTFLKKIGF